MRVVRRPSFALLGLVVTHALDANAEPAAELEPYRVSYDAPATCPEEPVFLEQVRARVGTGWEARPGALARPLTVRVASDGLHSAARLEYQDDSGNVVTRTVAANTCEEVVSGIALVTALALEARLPKMLAPAPVATPAAPVLPGLPPPVLLPPASSPAPASPRISAAPRFPAPVPVPPRRPSPYRFQMGAGFNVASGVAPLPAFGPRGFFGVRWPRGLDLRVGIDAALTTTFEVAPTRNRAALYAARVTGCPLSLGDRVTVSPCLGALVGILHTEGDGGKSGAGTYDPGSANPGFVAPFLALRGAALFDPVFLELEADGRFPLDNHKFSYDGDAPALAKVNVYEVPRVAFGAALSIGLRL